MIESLTIRVYVTLALVALCIAALGYAHHRGAVSQRATDTQQLAKVQGELNSTRAQLADAARALVAANAATDQAKLASQAQQAYAEAAVADLQHEGEQRAKDAAAWAEKLKAAEHAKGCAAQLQADLCADVPQGY